MCIKSSIRSFPLPPAASRQSKQAAASCHPQHQPASPMLASIGRAWDMRDMISASGPRPQGGGGPIHHHRLTTVCLLTVLSHAHAYWQMRYSRPRSSPALICGAAHARVMWWPPVSRPDHWCFSHTYYVIPLTSVLILLHLLPSRLVSSLSWNATLVWSGWGGTGGRVALPSSAFRLSSSTFLALQASQPSLSLSSLRRIEMAG